jgi:hypothetical protein
VPTVSATPYMALRRSAAPLLAVLALVLAACATPAGTREAKPEGPEAAACPASVPLPPPEGGPFVWRNPLPQGDSLLSVWGFGPDNLWAVGDRGRVLHYDGSDWLAADPGPRDYLAGIWGSAPDDLFVTGYNGQVLHFDGSRWWTQPTGVTNDFNGIWGSGPDDVFTVGDRGVILHYDGACWRPQETGTEDLFFGVSGSGPTDVWAVGGRGNVAHYDGTRWETVDVTAVAPDAHFVSVWAAAPGEVYVAGTGGTVLRLHDGTWTRQDVGTGTLLRWVWGTGPKDVWVAGDGATVRRFDGTAWRPVAIGIDAPPGGPMEEGEHAIRGAWRAGPGETTVLVGDDGLIVMGNLGKSGKSGAADALRPVRTGPVADLYAVAGSWAAGSAGAVLFRDMEAHWHALPSVGDETFLALALLADGRVLAGGTGGLWLGSAGGWRRLPWPEGVPPGPVFGLKAWDRRAVAVGAGGLVLAFDGDALSVLPSPGEATLFDLAGSGPEHFLAVGTEGAAYLWDGAAWRAVPVPGGEDLMAVSDGGVAVGAMGGIYHMKPGRAEPGATGWRTLAGPGGTALNAVADDPGGGAWAVGDFGAVRLVEGDGVREVDAGTGRTLRGVTVAPDGRITLVGDGGAVLERPPAPTGVKIK